MTLTLYTLWEYHSFLPEKTSVSDKLYTVTQLAKELGITARTVRFYEDKGLLNPQRAGNRRIFAHRDKVRLILILRGKRVGFSLRQIKEYLDLYDADPTQKKQWRDLLKKVDSRIDLLMDQQKALTETLGELNKLKHHAEAGLNTSKPVNSQRVRKTGD